MINKEIKSKIENNIGLTKKELQTYFIPLSSDPPSGFFKKRAYNKQLASHEETTQYILANFGSILENIETIQLSNFLKEYSFYEHQEELLQAISTNKLKLVPLLVTPIPGQSPLSEVLAIYLINSPQAHKFFESDFKEFYKDVYPPNFCWDSFFIFDPEDPEIHSLLLDGLYDCISDNTIHKSEATWFLEEYIRNKNINFETSQQGNPFSITEEMTSFFQAAFPVDKALNLLSASSEPLKTLSQLRNIGVDYPELSEFINTHIGSVVAEITKNSLSDSHQNIFTKTVLNELLEHEGVQLSDVSPIGKGGFSRAFQVGDKVLKFGSKPFTPNIPYNSEKFLQPLLRTELSNSDHIEVFEKVQLGTSIEEMYQLYKELRDQGLIWTDIKSGNVGRLLKDNTIHFEGIESIAYNAVGFEEDKKIPVAKKGDIVLLDLDFVFPANSKEIEIPAEMEARNNYLAFSHRYNQERRAQKELEKSKAKPTGDKDFD